MPDDFATFSRKKKLREIDSRLSLRPSVELQALVQKFFRQIDEFTTLKSTLPMLNQPIVLGPPLQT